jgi:hypothetical protein
MSDWDRINRLEMDLRLAEMEIAKLKNQLAANVCSACSAPVEAKDQREISHV